MSLRNYWIFAFLCVFGLNEVAHATPDAVEHPNLGSFRPSNLAGPRTTVAGVVAATHLCAGIAAISCRLPVLPCKNFDNQFAGNPNHIVCAGPGFAFSTSTRHGF